MLGDDEARQRETSGYLLGAGAWRGPARVTQIRRGRRRRKPRQLHSRARWQILLDIAALADVDGDGHDFAAVCSPIHPMATEVSRPPGPAKEQSLLDMWFSKWGFMGSCVARRDRPGAGVGERSGVPRGEGMRSIALASSPRRQITESCRRLRSFGLSRRAAASMEGRRGG